MLDNNNRQIQLTPGKKIPFIEGEVQTVYFYDWGVIGKIRINSQIFNFKITTDLKLKNEICIGMNLSFEDGYCTKNEKGEIFITDGKFGKIAVSFKLNQFFYQKNGQQLLTGIITSIDYNTTRSIIKFEPFISMHNKIDIIIPAELNSKLQGKTLSLYKHKTVRVKVNKNGGEYTLVDLEALHEEHFWNKFICIHSGKYENLNPFLALITKQESLIASHYESFKEELMNIWGNITKSDLVKLKDLLFSKVSLGEWRFPYNLLLPEWKIDEYLDEMKGFVREIPVQDRSNEKIDNVLRKVNYYYPFCRLTSQDITKLYKDM